MILPCIAIALLLSVTLYSAAANFRTPSAGDSPAWLFPVRANRSIRVFAGFCTLALVAFFIGLAVWSDSDGENAGSRASQFLIPEGYMGWVRIEFGVPETPEIPVQNGEYLFHVPRTGVLNTSSKMPHRSRWDRYYYDSNGRKGKLDDTGRDGQRSIWGKISGTIAESSGERTFEEFFVGTEQQFREQAKPTAPGTAK